MTVPSTLDPALIQAYEHAEYRAGTVEMRIGKPSATLDSWLAEAGEPAAVFVTAANPYSESRPEAYNRTAMATLEKQLQAAGLPYLHGEGRDPRGTWREPSFLVAGLALEEAKKLGRQHRQNAIVWAERGKAPELVLLR